MVDNSAAKVSIPALSASAYTVEQTKTRRGTYMDRIWSTLLWNVFFYWLHQQIVSSLRMRESQAKQDGALLVWDCVVSFVFGPSTAVCNLRIIGRLGKG